MIAVYGSLIFAVGIWTYIALTSEPVRFAYRRRRNRRRIAQMRAQTAARVRAMQQH